MNTLLFFLKSLYAVRCIWKIMGVTRGVFYRNFPLTLQSIKHP
jgi:hypothetical protein